MMKVYNKVDLIYDKAIEDIYNDPDDS